jgi:hypothetical protein
MRWEESCGGDGSSDGDERAEGQRGANPTQMMRLSAEVAWGQLLSSRSRPASQRRASGKSERRSGAFGRSFSFWRPESRQKPNQTPTMSTQWLNKRTEEKWKILCVCNFNIKLLLAASRLWCTMKVPYQPRRYMTIWCSDILHFKGDSWTLV